MICDSDAEFHEIGLIPFKKSQRAYNEPINWREHNRGPSAPPLATPVGGGNTQKHITMTNINKIIYTSLFAKIGVENKNLTSVK